MKNIKILLILLCFSFALKAQFVGQNGALIPTPLPLLNGGTNSTTGVAGTQIAQSTYKSIAGAVVNFGGFNIRWFGTNIELATVTGTKSIDFMNLGSYSFAATGNLNTSTNFLDMNNFPTPLTITATYQTLGDPGLVQSEVRRYRIWDNSTNLRYVVEVVKKGSTATDGFVEFYVYKN